MGRVIGGILEYAGVGGLLKNQPDRSADPERAGWEQFAHALKTAQDEGLVPPAHPSSRRRPRPAGALPYLPPANTAGPGRFQISALD